MVHVVRKQILEFRSAKGAKGAKGAKASYHQRSKLDAYVLRCVFIGSDMPSELSVSMSDELPSDDRLPAAGMFNKLLDDGLSSDDSSNSLIQDDGIHELPPRANRGKPKVQYEPDMHAKAKYPINNYVFTHRLSKPYASYISNQDCPLLQFDVKNAFLHGDLKEEVYMDLPHGIRTSLGKCVSHLDHTLVLKRQNGKLTALIIYDDDMIVTGDDQKEIQHLQKYLATKFEIKELGELKYFLGIKVARSKHDQVPTHKERCQRLVRRLIYLSHTRPDIAYVVSVVSQFMHSHSEAHMDAVTRILRYLKIAPGRDSVFSKNSHLNVEGYTDADWAGSITDR
uniref:Putative polyprotein (Retrotrasposon protein) n=1 Tax=Malus domestica TaxID=3750 RepID=E4Z8N1_MALDO|nr:putative polyprotein (retrotrasposon protein) [Malus domestica]